jgi:hypothetical protein
MNKHFVAGYAFTLAVCCNVSLVNAQGAVFDFRGQVTGEDKLPAPWKILGHPVADKPAFTVEDDPQLGRVMRMHAKGNQADAIYRQADVDLSETPYLNFSWKVAKHPTGQIGTDRNDQAVKVQLEFGLLGLKRHVISYIYDPKAKVGTWHDDSSFFAKNRALVLDTSDEHLGKWIAHSRNVVEDYQRCYKRKPPRVNHISIFCDSNHSDSESLGYCSPISFSEGPQHDRDDE